MTNAVKRPTQARLRDIPRATWLLARAFTSTSAQAAGCTAIALRAYTPAAASPILTLVVTSSVVARHLHLDDSRTGMVILEPKNSVRAGLGWAVAFIPLVLAAVLLGVAAALLPSGLVETVLVILVSASVALLVEMLVSSRLTKEERRTLQQLRRPLPQGKRWDLMMLAQMPGTKRTAALLARHLLVAIPPPGSVVVVAARTPDLHTKYRKYGFTPTSGKRLFRITPNVGGSRQDGPIADTASRRVYKESS